jgi:predicted MPP superfamily phosphohydrolase
MGKMGVRWTVLTPTTEAEESLRRRYLLSFMVVVATSGVILVWHWRSVLRFLRSRFGLLVIVILSAPLVYACIEPVLLEYTYNDIRVPKSFTPFTAVQLSDFHFQWAYRHVTESTLVGIVEKVSRLRPDFIFVTGDLVSRYRTNSISEFNAQTVGRFLSALRAQKGVYGVLGNNDYCAVAKIIREYEKSGVRLLRNESVLLTPEIQLSGIDSARTIEAARARIENLSILDARLRILLAHEPDVPAVAADKFDLQISGHTHGGQVVLPFGLGPLILPSMGRRFPMGLHKVQNMLVYISKGIGISPLPKPLMRFNCRPEVSVLRIVPDPSQSH